MIVGVPVFFSTGFAQFDSMRLTLGEVLLFYLFVVAYLGAFVVISIGFVLVALPYRAVTGKRLASTVVHPE